MASTIKDIRAETGLALATISKYLNGGNVKQENREKIEAAIKKLDYRPNEMARSLITKKTRTIAFVTNVMDSQFSGVLLKYTGELLRRQGYSMMICDSNHDPVREEENIRFCIDKKVDGILLLPVNREAAAIRSMLGDHVPMVLLDREMTGDVFDCVTIDNRQAARRGTDYLREMGHQKIGVIYSKEYTGYERFLGYLDSLQAGGITPREEYLQGGERHSTQLGYRCMKQLMMQKDPPTAVLMTNYEVGLGVVMAMNELQLRCPEDVSLVGFDELVLSLVMKPKITVLAQPMEEICREAVTLLLERIAGLGDVGPRHLSIYARLREGESVGSV